MVSDNCRFHPQRPAMVNCSKHGMGLCAQCLEEKPHCPDPEIYCKFRPQCVIYFQHKEKSRSARQGESP